jgi:hypothetical protein
MKRLVYGILICMLGAAFYMLFYRGVSQIIPSSPGGQGIWQDKSELTAIASGREIPCYGTRQEMIAAAEKGMQEKVPLITDKEVLPPSGDTRDYTSLASDYWPDSLKIDGIPYVQRKGEVNPEKWDEKRYDAGRFITMTNTVKNLARGYVMTGRKVYAERALSITREWFINGTTRMNPRLSYAQMVPGKSGGRSTGLIETAKLIEVVDALYLLRDCCSQEEWQSYQSWFRAYTYWLRTSQLGKDAARMQNHYGLWYDAQVCAFAHFAGQDEEAREILEAFPEKRLAVQIADDGSLPADMESVRSLSDSLNALWACLTIARVGEEMGINLYDIRSSNGRSLKLAIDYILPYAKGEKIMQEENFADDNAAPFWLSLHLANRHFKNPAYEK